MRAGPFLAPSGAAGQTSSDVLILRPNGIADASVKVIDAGIYAYGQFLSVSESVHGAFDALGQGWIVSPERIATNAIIVDTYDALEALKEWRDNWDRRGALAPNLAAIANAKRWITDLFVQVQDDAFPLLRPTVTANVENEIVFAWRNGIRRVTVYVTPETTFFVESWGMNIYDDMADGDADSSDARRALWHFLMQ